MRRTGIVATLVAVAAVVLFGATAPVAAVEVGDTAPDFTLPATTKDTVSMNEFRGKNVLLFGFIGAFTPT